MAIPQTLFEFIFQNVDFLMEVIGGEGADLLENFVRKSGTSDTNCHEYSRSRKRRMWLQTERWRGLRGFSLVLKATHADAGREERRLRSFSLRKYGIGIFERSLGRIFGGCLVRSSALSVSGWATLQFDPLFDLAYDDLATGM